MEANLKSHSSYTFRILVSLGLWAVLIVFNLFTQQRFLSYMRTIENRWTLASTMQHEIAYLANQLRPPPSMSTSDRQKLAGEMESHISRLIASHSDLALNIRGREMQELFHRDGRLDEDVRQFVSIAKAAQTSLSMGARSLPIAVEKSIHAWLRSEAPVKMQTVVGFFEKQMEDSRNKLNLWNFLIAGVSVMTLLIQYYGVFRPMGFEIFENLMKDEFVSSNLDSRDNKVIQFPLSENDHAKVTESPQRKTS